MLGKHAGWCVFKYKLYRIPYKHIVNTHNHIYKLRANSDNVFSPENQKHSFKDCQPLGLRLISQKANLKVIVLKYFSMFFVAEVTDLPSLGFLDEGYLTCCWNRDGGFIPPLRCVLQSRWETLTAAAAAALCSAHVGQDMRQLKLAHCQHWSLLLTRSFLKHTNSTEKEGIRL